MKVVILCGGKGIRAFPFTECIPKPMLPVNGSPIIVQIIRGFMAQGFREFVLAAGYRKSVLDDYFDGKVLGASIEILDTGIDADTGERIAACRDAVGEEFLVTYGDGLADVDCHNLLTFHQSHAGLATVTAAPLSTQYGVLETNDNGRVTAMKEKPTLHDHWINIGFMVFHRDVFDHWSGTNLESHVLPALAARQELFMFRHRGFFKSMDSYKDQQEFEELDVTENPPWAYKAGSREAVVRR